MKLRPLAAGAVLVAVALFGSACGKDDAADPNPSGSAPAEEQTVDARAELKTALEKSAEQTSLKMEMESTGVHIVTRVDVTAEAAHMVSRTETDGDTLEVEMLTLGPDTYVKYISGGLAEVMQGKWTRVDSASVGTDKVLSDNYFDTEDLLKDGVVVTKMDDGRYKVELGAGEVPDVGGLFGGLTGGEEPDPSASGRPVAMIIAVNSEGLVSSLTAEGATEKENVTVGFSDYGTPLKIEKPADEDIAEG